MPHPDEKERKPISGIGADKMAPGRMVPGQGIFLGEWEPKDRNGNSLKKLFNVFAAPQDLKDASGRKLTLTYNEAVERVAGLKNWQGHDGGRFKNDAAVYSALRNGTYKGEWFIPSRDLLDGRTSKGARQPDNLHAHRDKGAFAGTLTTPATRQGLIHYGFYWSCTELRLEDLPIMVAGINILDGQTDFQMKDTSRLNCRPVRVVEIPRR